MMRVRMLVLKTFADAMAGGAEPATTEVRAWFGDAPIPPAYMQVVPDRRGGLIVAPKGYKEKAAVEGEA